MHPLAIRMVESYMRRLNRELGCVIVDGEEIRIVGGDEYGKKLERLAAMAKDVFTFIDEAFKMSTNGKPKLVLAEGYGSSVIYGRINENVFLVSFYRDMPAGTMMYETRRLVDSLREIWDRLIKHR